MKVGPWIFALVETSQLRLLPDSLGSVRVGSLWVASERCANSTRVIQYALTCSVTKIRPTVTASALPTFLNRNPVQSPSVPPNDMARTLMNDCFSSMTISSPGPVLTVTLSKVTGAGQSQWLDSCWKSWISGWLRYRAGIRSAQNVVKDIRQ